MNPRRLLATTVAVMVGLGMATTAPGQELTRRGEIEMIGMTGTVGPGTRAAANDSGDDTDDDTGDDVDETVDDVILRLAVTNSGELPLEDLRVTASLHPSSTVRSSLHRALDDDDLDSRSLLGAEADVDDLVIESGETLGVRVVLPSVDIPWPDDPAVLPIAVALFAGSEQLDTFTTAVVWLPRAVRPSLHEVVVVPLTGAPTIDFRGRYTDAVLAATTPGSRIRTAIAELSRRPDARVVVAPDVVLIEELAGRAPGYVSASGTTVPADADAATTAADTLASLTELIQGLPLDPVVGPYGKADIAALTELQPIPQITALAPEALTTARTRLQGLVGRAPDLGTHLATTITTPAVVDLVRDQRILLPYSHTSGPPADNEPALPSPLGQVQSGSGSVISQTIVTDPHVDAILRDTSSDAGIGEAVQRLRVELAQLWLESPSRDRALLVIVPDDVTPSRRLLSGWLDVLLGDPWLDPGSPRQVSDAVTRTGVTVSLAAATNTATTPVVGLLGTDLVLLAALEAAAGDTTLDTPLTLLRDAVMRASATIVTDPDTAIAELDAVRATLDLGFGAVDIGGGSRTLTSEVGDIPVTIRRVSGGPLNVVVRIDSTGRLVWEPGTQTQRLTLAAGTSRTVAFNTRAVSRGTFPVTVTVLDPTETKVLATSTLTVRSTAFASPPSLLLIGLVVVALLTVSYRRRKRPLELIETTP